MCIQFIDRRSELERLDSFWDTPEGIYVLWGRRRVGKTTLLQKFSEDKPSIYLMATNETEKGILENFTREVAAFFEDPALSNTTFDSFKDLIRYMEEKREERLLLIIDEFPYLCDANKSVPSIIQREWDSGDMEGMNIILSGSTVSAMESEVLGSKSPLYGRRTGQYKLSPLDPIQARGFFPEIPLLDYLKLYATIGGTPEYLLKMESDKELIPNIIDNIADPGSMLHEEPELLLKSEVREPRTYFSILKALSFGRSTPNEIATFVDVQRTSISRYLKLLIKLDLVEKRVPVTEKHPEKTRKGRYFIQDPFFRFYFRFIFQHKPQLEQGLYEGLKDTLKGEFNTYMGPAFEDIVLAALIQMEKNDETPFTFHKIGPWWSNEGQEIDIVAFNGSTKEVMFVECKWSDLDEQRTRDIVTSLEEKAELVKWDPENRKEHYMVAGRSVEGTHDVQTLSLEDIKKVTKTKRSSRSRERDL